MTNWPNRSFSLIATMENDAVEIIRRASLISQGLADKRRSLEEKKVRELNRGPEPKDTFYLVHILLILTGLMQLLPRHFFITANAYWMYKFRDTALDTVDSNHRTSMQTFFVSWISIVSSIPSVTSIILSTFYGHKVRTRSRLLVTLFVVFLCFIVFTGFIEINTDSWQLGFFILTMLVIILINTMVSLFHASSMALIAKFPPQYVQWYLYGEGSSELVSAILQIMSLAISPSTETSALIYFVVGTIILGTTLLLIFVSKYSPLMQYHVHSDREDMDTKRPVHTIAEIAATLKQIWPCILLTCVMYLTGVATHPNITTLVVSENAGSGSEWSDKYFVPVITFLGTSVTSLIGRFIAGSLIMKRSNQNIWILVVIVRGLLYIPLEMLCNALPRHHMPVIFRHDWQYAVISGTQSFSGGAIYNSLFLSMQGYAAGNEELAYLSMITFISIYGSLVSPLGLIFVRML